ncbi:hypothetical protein BJ138DRAFT_1159366 [Hygrophoropsis aurantiaca]|uniref:Uncharacterized protein n=1 Tax=Hygrophoropsis aurantiaca TaxID=72124 RepID=A0ACB8A2I0_9AGAM|nr:hypothetical protein BJ138DRAFT_1159366 [Hygrophoropsis aurantiaca]
MADLGFIQELQMEQTTHYLTAVAGALVAYDHVLTFSQEVDLVWNRQWSFVTALYLTVCSTFPLPHCTLIFCGTH